ncbi:MAG: hypothetical protein HKL80_06465 [Acidimicrobiales bacterium]|nr:hypothetical protein [Acidimicrobiales bacterium]
MKQERVMTLRNKKENPISSSGSETKSDLDIELNSTFTKLSDTTMFDFDEASMEGKLDLIKQKAQSLQNAKGEQKALSTEQIESIEKARPSRKVRLSLAGAIAATLSLAGIFTFFTGNHSSLQASHSTSTVAVLKAPTAAQIAQLEAKASPTCPTGIMASGSAIPLLSCLGQVTFSSESGLYAVDGSAASTNMQSQNSNQGTMAKVSMKVGDTIYILLQQVPGTYEWKVLGTRGGKYVASKNSLLGHTGSLLLTIHALSIGNYSIEAGEFWSGAACTVSTSTGSCLSTTLPMKPDSALITFKLSVSISK